MKIRWLGHSCFLITSESGTRMLTDPYAVGGGIRYSPITETADIVTVSHEHDDHNNVSAVRGKPEVIRGDGAKSSRGIQLKGISSYHDEAGGKQRGHNTIFCFAIDGIELCHLGDLGHQLSLEQIGEIGDVDILLIPVGGLFTIDASVATQLCSNLKPRVIIPMHFKAVKCDYPIAGVEDFLVGKENVRRVDSSEVEFTPKTLPTTSEIVVLEPAL